jgi:hypothetical protein
MRKTQMESILVPNEVILYCPGFIFIALEMFISPPSNAIKSS